MPITAKLTKGNCGIYKAITYWFVERLEKIGRCQACWLAAEEAAASPIIFKGGIHAIKRNIKQTR